MLSVKPWRAEAVLLFLAAQACSLFLGAVAMGLLQEHGVAGFKDLDSPGNILIGTLCLQGATWVLMGVLFRFYDIHWRDALGFSKGNLIYALILAFLTTVLVLFVVLWLQIISTDVIETIVRKLHWHWTPKEEAAVSLLAGANSPGMKIYLGFFAVVLAPVAEEFIFRGLLYPFIKQLGFPRTAWIVVSLLFALVHLDVIIFVPLFVLSLVLIWLYEMTDNLMAPIFAHVLFNTANLVLLYFYPQ